jgi:hypothetical protein
MFWFCLYLFFRFENLKILRLFKLIKCSNLKIVWFWETFKSENHSNFQIWKCSYLKRFKKIKGKT